MDGDVQAAVADGVVGAREAATVTELGQDRGRTNRANAVEVGDQGAAARLAAGERAQRPVERGKLPVESLRVFLCIGGWLGVVGDAVSEVDAQDGHSGRPVVTGFP